MSYSAKILDDSIAAPFVVGLVQIPPAHQVLAETSSNNKLSVYRIGGVIALV
jgi:hypothetical protein